MVFVVFSFEHSNFWHCCQLVSLSLVLDFLKGLYFSGYFVFFRLCLYSARLLNLFIPCGYFNLFFVMLFHDFDLAPHSISEFTFFSIDGTNEKRFGKFVNDTSPQFANCTVRSIEMGNKEIFLCIFAIKDIKDGEELRYSYGSTGLHWRKIGYYLEKILYTANDGSCAHYPNKLTILSRENLKISLVSVFIPI